MAKRRFIENIKERLAKEVGTVYKPHAGRLRFALAFPNSYYVGMSNLGLQTVYRILNEREDSVCERVFLPDPSDADELLRTGDRLVTMESQTPVRDFDVLAFSVSYELDYANVLRILRLSGIEESAAERGPADPLVIAGGPTATFNPEVLAPFVDAFVIGEAEEVLPEVVDLLAEGCAGDREELLLKLAHVDGVYAPRFYEPEYNDDGTIRRVRATHGVPETVRRCWLPRLESHAAASVILTPETEFSNMILAEVARGCGRKCRFCVAGYTYLPPRAGSPDGVLDAIRRAEERFAKSSGSRPRIGLISASIFDHPSSMLICQSLAERDRLFSISSTRADTLNRDIAQILRRGGQETLTIAPEAGSYRLRCAIGKGMTDEDLISAAAAAWDGGFRRLKLYFMVGLPTETPDDVVGIVNLVSRIASMFEWTRLTVSLSCFVPKPWTPFQWAAMAGEKELAGKVNGLRNALRSLSRVEVVGESAREAVAQGVLSRGDRRLRDALLLASRENVNWRTAFKLGGVAPAFYAQRARNRDEVFPWDHVSTGVPKEFLWREYENAVR